MPDKYTEAVRRIRRGLNVRLESQFGAHRDQLVHTIEDVRKLLGNDLGQAINDLSLNLQVEEGYPLRNNSVSQIIGLYRTEGERLVWKEAVLEFRASSMYSIEIFMGDRDHVDGEWTMLWIDDPTFKGDALEFIRTRIVEHWAKSNNLENPLRELNEAEMELLEA